MLPPVLGVVTAVEMTFSCREVQRSEAQILQQGASVPGEAALAEARAGRQHRCQKRKIHWRFGV